MTTKSTSRIAVVKWEEGDGIASAISNAIEVLGYEVIDVLYNSRLQGDVDIVLVYGPLGSLVPLTKQLLAFPPSQRPVFVLWMTEQLPNPNLPERLLYMAGAVRSRAERLAFQKDAQGVWRLDPRLRWMTRALHRFRYYGDLYWLKQQRIPWVLAIGSRWIAKHLRERGFSPVEAYLGSHPAWGADLRLERDISVLWLGQIGSERRRRALKRLRAELRTRGTEILMIDGIENPCVFGEAERRVLLNRTKIVVNILRTKWDNNGLRYYLAAPNRALIITEPTLPHTPFMPGMHLVEAPVEHMADTVYHYLTNEEERKYIVEKAYQLVTTDLTMKKGVSQILEKATAMRKNTRKSECNQISG
jgi:hypothetical protein